MNARPQGASVVPTIAVIARSASRSTGIDGTTSPRAAAPQSGPASSPAAMYAANAVASSEEDVLDPVKAAPSTSSDTSHRG